MPYSVIIQVVTASPNVNGSVKISIAPSISFRTITATFVLMLNKEGRRDSDLLALYNALVQQLLCTPVHDLFLYT